MSSLVIGFTPAFAVQVNHRGTVHEQLATHIQRQLVHLYWVRTHVRYRQRATIDDFHVAQNFNALIKAYQAMIAEDFDRFVGFFVEAGRDLNAVDENGETILDLVSRHRRSTAYAETLRKAGAKTTAEAGS